MLEPFKESLFITTKTFSEQMRDLAQTVILATTCGETAVAPPGNITSAEVTLIDT